MLREHAAGDIGVEQTLAPQPIGAQIVLHHAREIRSDPATERCPEATLLALEYVARQAWAQVRSLQIPEFETAHTHRCRGLGHELDEPVIEIGHPCLQRLCHRHLVGQHQQLLGQGSLEVEVHHLIEHFACVGVSHRLA